MGQDGEARARGAARGRNAIGRLEASMTDLDPRWRRAFERDIAQDAAFERSLLLREWAVVVVIVLLLLVRRLFV